MQYEFELIPHEVRGELIAQRAKDGYICATAMCKAAGREWKHYNENRTSKAFLTALSDEVGIPTSELVQSIRGGPSHLQGTWVHPQVAIYLAQWLSPEFAVKVSQWVYEWMTGTGPVIERPLPYHLRRYVANHLNVPVGHFSILTELTQALIAPLEIMGYTLPEHMWPDISQGRMFCGYLRKEHGIDTKALPSYMHFFEEERPPVKANAYPEILLPDFRRHFREIWMPQKSMEYFRKRDPKALQYLPRMLPAPSKKAS